MTYSIKCLGKVNKKAPYVIIIFKARGKIINKFNKSTIRAASSLEGILILQSNGW